MSRRLEQSTSYHLRDGSTLRSDWEPFTGEGDAPPDTRDWEAKDFAAFVRAWNRAAKARGDQTVLRSVEEDDAF